MCNTKTLFKQTVRFYDTITLIIKDEAANVFLEISPHPVLSTSIRECYELTNQQQSSPPLILPTLKRKEYEQITLFTSLAQLTTLSQVWQQYFHTRQILPLKNHEEYFDNFPLYKFHLSPCWYESKDSSIQRLANHHKIQDAILFPAAAYPELVTTACHQLLPPKEDDQQQLTLIFEDVNFNKALILNEHELMEVFIQIIMPMREWYIIFCNQDNRNKYSLNEFTLYAQGKIEIDSKQQKSLTIPDRWTIQDIRSAYAHLSTRAYQYGSILLPGVETTFLPVRIQKFIYSSKTKIKTNQSTNIEVCGNYYDNIWGIDQEEIYNLDLWTFPMDNKIEEPIFTFESIVIQQIQGVQSGRCNQDLIESIGPFNELAAYYAQMAIKDLDLNQQHHPLLNACHSLASTLHEEVTWHSTQLRLIQLIERFPRLKPFLITLNKYGLHLKDILNNSFENYRLRIFWLTDSDCSDVLPILDLLLNLSQQTGLLIDLHYEDSDPVQLANAQQTFNTHLTNQKKISLLFMMKQLIYMILLVKKTISKEILQRLDERKNQIWLIFTKDDNKNNILSSLLPCSNIKIFDIRNSTSDMICFGIPVLLTTYKQVSIIFAWQLDQVSLNENNDDLAFKQNEELICGTLSRILQTIQKSSPYFHPFVYVLTDHAQFNNDSNLNIIASSFIGLARSLITEYERHRLQLIDLQTSLNNNNQSIFIYTLIEYMINSRYSTDTCEVVLRLNDTNQNQV
ncbi:unnamed protein product [Adineta steineri]|uniref:Polyketide synthase dehydratase domain-containing protein n=1 Tax=Adineta steineri TaxID=433720 RepID=A0A815J904_9BILA|nr:unnamed protein product [Adineta steineri]CAF1374848.1 unnamed protein product [Adineta steineri]